MIIIHVLKSITFLRAQLEWWIGKFIFFQRYGRYFYIQNSHLIICAHQSYSKLAGWMNLTLISSCKIFLPSIQAQSGDYSTSYPVGTTISFSHILGTWCYSKNSDYSFSTSTYVLNGDNYYCSIPIQLKHNIELSCISDFQFSPYARLQKFCIYVH